MAANGFDSKRLVLFYGLCNIAYLKKTRFSFAKAQVEVPKCLDGSIHIFYNKEELAYRPIPAPEKRYASPQVRTLPIVV